ncbi:MAG: hypothetical protein OHK0036_11590 [Bacteroidia bacterium]
MENMEKSVKTLALAFIILMSIAIQSMAQLHGTSPNWTTPIPLPKPNAMGYESKGGIGQNIIRLSSGELIQCFTENYPYPGGQTKIYFNKSTDDGVTWSIVNISNNPFLKTSVVSGPTFAVDTLDNIHVVWRRSAPTSDLYYAKFDKNFNLLIDTVRITQYKYDNSNVGSVYITVDRKNRVHVMWNDGSPETSSSSSYFTKVMYRQSIDGGQTWNNQITLSDITTFKHAAFPRANFSGVTGNTLAIPWRQEVSSSNWDVWMAYSTDGGNNWNRINVANSDSAEWDPGIVVDKNNRIHLHYHEYKKNNLLFTTMEYKYTDNLGATWSPVVTLSPAGIRSQLSVFSYDYKTDIQCICWKDERDYVTALNTNADVMCSFSTDGGNSWIGQEFVNDLDTVETIFKSVAVGSNGVIYVTFEYTDNTTGLRGLWFSKRISVIYSIEEIQNNTGYMIYPNPASNQINIISTKNNFEMSVQIYNFMGALVVETFTHNGSLDISSLQDGLYVLRIKEKDKWYTYKFIKNGL